MTTYVRINFWSGKVFERKRKVVCIRMISKLLLWMAGKIISYLLWGMKVITRRGPIPFRSPQGAKTYLSYNKKSQKAATYMMNSCTQASWQIAAHLESHKTWKIRKLWKFRLWQTRKDKLIDLINFRAHTKCKFQT